MLDVNDQSMPIIYTITPTYARPQQKAELTRLCNVFLLVPNLHFRHRPKRANIGIQCRRDKNVNKYVGFSASAPATSIQPQNHLPAASTQHLPLAMPPSGATPVGASNPGVGGQAAETGMGMGFCMANPCPTVRFLKHLRLNVKRTETRTL